METFSCARICSAIWSPIRITGLSDEIGSWKIIAISLPRTRSSSSSDAVIRSPPRSRAEPANRALGERVSPISVITVTDFPEPDSPTIATTSPRSRVNENPVHGVHEAVFGRERDLKVLHVQQRLSHRQSSPHVSGPLAGEPYPGVEQRVHDVG